MKNRNSYFVSDLLEKIMNPSVEIELGKLTLNDLYENKEIGPNCADCFLAKYCRATNRSQNNGCFNSAINKDILEEKINFSSFVPLASFQKNEIITVYRMLNAWRTLGGAWISFGPFDNNIVVWKREPKEEEIIVGEENFVYTDEKEKLYTHIYEKRELMPSLFRSGTFEKIRIIEMIGKIEKFMARNKYWGVDDCGNIDYEPIG